MAYFNPRPPRGERLEAHNSQVSAKIFQSTPSARRATEPDAKWPNQHAISIHALREESDREPQPRKYLQSYFNPRPPRGERLAEHKLSERDLEISIHALREESDAQPEHQPQRLHISIHALREESDISMVCSKYDRLISIHALREESDGERRASTITTSYFNPRPPRGERPMEGYLKAKESLFQSTPSARRATPLRGQTGHKGRISIHALREESDSLLPHSTGCGYTISIHALREESDQPSGYGRVEPSEFQSTPSARRATLRDPFRVAPAHISIHALREESDGQWLRSRYTAQHFNPRPPRGERRQARQRNGVVRLISIHALREESDDPPHRHRLAAPRISIHALREESDSKSSEKIQCFCSIIHTCAQFEKELYEGSGEMQNKSC